MTREEALAQPGATESTWGRILVTCPNGHEQVYSHFQMGKLVAQGIERAKADPHMHRCKACDAWHAPTGLSFRYEANAVNAEGKRIYP